MPIMPIHHIANNDERTQSLCGQSDAGRGDCILEYSASPPRAWCPVCVEMARLKEQTSGDRRMPDAPSKLVISQKEIEDALVAHVRRKMGWTDDRFLKVTFVTGPDHLSMEVELPNEAEGTD